MKILIISPYLPWPLYGGNVVRIYGILRGLSKRGHEIILLAGYEGPPLAGDHPVRRLCREVRFYPPPASARRARPVAAALASVLSPLPYTAAKFGGPAVERSIRAVLASDGFDLILANFAFTAHLIPAEMARRTPVVLDEHESEGLLWRQYRRQGGAAKRGFALLNLAKMRWFQKAVFSRIVALLSASEREADYTRTLLPPASSCGPFPMASTPNSLSLPGRRRPTRMPSCSVPGLGFIATRKRPCGSPARPSRASGRSSRQRNSGLWAAIPRPR